MTLAKDAARRAKRIAGTVNDPVKIDVSASTFFAEVSDGEERSEELTAVSNQSPHSLCSLLTATLVAALVVGHLREKGRKQGIDSRSLE